MCWEKINVKIYYYIQQIIFQTEVKIKLISDGKNWELLLQQSLILRPSRERTSGRGIISTGESLSVRRNGEQRIW